MFRRYSAVFALSAAGTCAVLLRPRAALAQIRTDAPPEQVRARVAYDRGTIAYRRGDFARAAAEYAQADQLVPTVQALEAALDSALLADDPVLGAELVERASQRARSGRLASLLAKARTQFADRTGRLLIACNPQRPCLASIDGVAVGDRNVARVRAGPHTVTLQVDGETQQRLVTVGPNADVEVAPAPASRPGERRETSGAAAAPAAGSRPFEAEPSPPKAVSAATGLSPAWFFAGIGATALVGGAAVLSAVDTASRHDRFVADGCQSSSSSDCPQLALDGQAAQNRTNALLGSSIALGAVSAALGAFFVRWRSARPAASLGVSPTGAVATLRISL